MGHYDICNKCGQLHGDGSIICNKCEPLPKRSAEDVLIDPPRFSGSIYDHEHDEDPRPGWGSIYMNFAFALSERSSCNRASVGSVITSWDHNRVLAIGYNGNYRGGPNCCDTTQPGACGCLHAEENAIIKLDYNDHSAKILYTTVSPCVMCAKRILNAGIMEVRYCIQYRDIKGLALLQNNGVTVKQWGRGTAHHCMNCKEQVYLGDKHTCFDDGSQ